VLDGHDARPARLHHDRPLEADCGIQLATGAAFVKDAKVPVRVDFSDDVAGPFPANFLCFTVGRSCDTNAGDIYGYNASCSVPATGGKSTTFSCTADYGAVADGTVSACVVAADASIPDNPSGSNQTASADKANLSHPSCDEVVVDRTPPAVSIAVAKTTVEVGELVALQATASDATSGLAGAAQWSWGDNTGGGSGDAVTAHLHPGRDLRGRADRRRRGRQRRHGEEGHHRQGRGPAGRWHDDPARRRYDDPARRRYDDPARRWHDDPARRRHDDAG
jgi:hypothetical protein